MAQTFICKNCGIIFRGKTGKKNLTCSLACRREAGIKSRQRTCAQCGKEFLIDNIARDAIHCSRQCAGKTQRVRVSFTCLHCGKQFDEQPSEDRKYCCHKCFLASTPGRQRPTMRGKPSWNKGLTADTNAVIAAHALRHSGKGSPLWKGGSQKYYGPNWDRQSRHARERDGYKCRHCGISQEKLGRKLDVHHIVTFRSFGYIRNKNDYYLQANHLNNLITLCPHCHKQAEWKQIPIQPTLLSA